MKITSLAVFCAAGTVAALCAPGAQAQVSLSSPTVTVTIMEGQTMMFTTNVTNTSASSVTFGGDDVNFLTMPTAGQTEYGPSSSVLTVALDDTPYFSSLPVTLGGSTQALTLYSVTAGLASIPGTYTGYFTLQDDSGNDLVGGTQNFSITVSPLASAPEPSGWAVFAVGAGMAGLVALRRRRPAS